LPSEIHNKNGNVIVRVLNLNNVVVSDKSVDIIISEFGSVFDVVVVAGSGVHKAIEAESIIARLPYSAISELNGTSVKGHGNELLLVSYNGVKCLMFTGRFHLYEGNSLESVVMPCLLANRLKIGNAVLTNAAGGLHPLLNAGDVMLIESMVNFTQHTILQDNHTMPSFKLQEDWKNRTEASCLRNGVRLRSGVYVSLTGPCYETKAEVRMYRKIGDAIGMSTIHEYYAASQLGMNVIACSMITNTLTDTASQEVTHDEVLQVASIARHEMGVFIKTACLATQK